ncbi:hypothetical protein ABZ372_53950, partial [Streptomyces sp. NPDC005921]
LGEADDGQHPPPVRCLVLGTPGGRGRGGRGRRLALRTAGLLHQLLRSTGHDPADALPDLDRLIDTWCADYHDSLGARWIPVARQAEYQTRVVLSAFELAHRHARAGARSGEPGWGAEAAVPMHRE